MSTEEFTLSYEMSYRTMEKHVFAYVALIIKITDIKWKEIHDNVYDGNSREKNFPGISLM